MGGAPSRCKRVSIELENHLFTSKARLYAVPIAACLLLASCSAPAPSTQGSLSNGKLSLSPAAEVVYKCITDKGWEVELTWDGGINASSETIPEAQVDQYHADSAECWAIIDDRVANMKPEEIEKVYAEELATIECLTSEGYSVSAPPSKQQYVDTFFGDRWSAFAASDAMPAGLSNDEWRAINEKCTQPAWSLGL